MSITDSFLVDPVSGYAPEDDLQPCAKCRRFSRPVTRKTVLLMLKSDRLEQVGQRDYRFCADSECPVVYFSEECDTTFVKEDLRVRVGLKERVDPRPLCYCFGFNEKDVREEFAGNASSQISQRIAGLIKQGMCACETKNPSGACCLGEVNEVINKMLSLA